MRVRAPSHQTRVILGLLVRQPLEWRHGYDVAKLAAISSGTLYPILVRLHDRGFLEAKWLEPERPGRPPRHAYRLSADGLTLARQLEAQAAATPLRATEALA